MRPKLRSFVVDAGSVGPVRQRVRSYDRPNYVFPTSAVDI